MLDKELDKLRDKTLSFWCVVDIWRQWPNPLIRCLTIWYNKYKDIDWEYIYEEFCPDNIIWHPLTRWRIEYLHHTKNDNTEEYWYILSLLRDNPELYNQSELERQTHEKRPELKKLLIQFSNYLK